LLSGKVFKTVGNYKSCGSMRWRRRTTAARAPAAALGAFNHDLLPYLVAQSISAMRFTAGASGFLTLIQSRERSDL
jgi:hypothetical protein